MLKYGHFVGDNSYSSLPHFLSFSRSLLPKTTHKNEGRHQEGCAYKIDDRKGDTYRKYQQETGSDGRSIHHHHLVSKLDRNEENEKRAGEGDPDSNSDDGQEKRITESLSQILPS